jgi:hypothetical protein
MKKLTTKTYEQHVKDNDGYCVKCKKVTTFGDVEPDAEEYTCEVCGEETVLGMEGALLLDYIEIDEDAEEEDEDDVELFDISSDDSDF